MAVLLAKVATTTRKIEQRLSVRLAEDPTGVSLDVDPLDPSRRQGAVLVRKALIHIEAALRANESNNLHSLAVQTRPALECAGQVVFISKTLMIDPGFTMDVERAIDMLADYNNADYYGTMIRGTAGQLSHEELLATSRDAEVSAAVSLGMAEPPPRRGKSLKQADKVAPLKGGREWYGFLSEYFCHGRADWRGPLWHGGVVPTGTVRDEFSFLGVLGYLAEQMAVMNSSAALWSVPGETREMVWSLWVEPTLAELSQVREESRSILGAAFHVPSGDAGEAAGTD